jgi:hypothetical protein
MSKWGWAIRLGGYAGAPFTAGMSVPASQIAAGALEKKQHANDVPGGGKTDGKAHPEDPYTNILNQYSQQAQQQGQQLTGMGTEALAPAMQYLKQILGADPQAVLEATRADRGRVIDQYDSARKAVENFGPRGGGTTSALAQSRFSQAESLGDITSNARRSAVASAGQLGTSLAGLGLTANDMASRDISTIINSVLAREGLNVQQRGQNMAMWGDIGQTIGTLIGIYLGRDQGGGGGGQPPGVGGGILG